MNYIFEKINTPTLAIALEMQKRIDRFYSPAHRSIIKSQKAAKAMLNSDAAFLKHFKAINELLLINSKIEASQFVMKSKYPTK